MAFTHYVHILSFEYDASLYHSYYLCPWTDITTKSGFQSWVYLAWSLVAIKLKYNLYSRSDWSRDNEYGPN